MEVCSFRIPPTLKFTFITSFFVMFNPYSWQKSLRMSTSIAPKATFSVLHGFRALNDWSLQVHIWKQKHAHSPAVNSLFREHGIIKRSNPNQYHTKNDLYLEFKWGSWWANGMMIWWFSPCHYWALSFISRLPIIWNCLIITTLDLSHNYKMRFKRCHSLVKALRFHVIPVTAWAPVTEFPAIIGTSRLREPYWAAAPHMTNRTGWRLRPYWAQAAERSLATPGTSPPPLHGPARLAPLATKTHLSNLCSFEIR